MELQPRHDPFGAFVSVLNRPGRPGGPLSGLRLCVKDNIEVEGAAYTAGHPLFRERIGKQTAKSVSSLLEAGADLVGMASTDAGGLGMTTPSVDNPWLPGKTVGGSSGGCAAAVAGGLADLALGTDTGGSVRVPAACTNIYGFKPTYGLVPTDGAYPLASQFDHIGLMARDLDIITTGVDVLLGPGRPPYVPPKLRICVERNLPAYTNPDNRTRFAEVVTRLTEAGHEILVSDLPPREAMTEDFGVVVVAEAKAMYDAFSEEQKALLGPAARKALAYDLDKGVLERSKARLDELKSEFEIQFDKWDIMISPTLLIAPPPRGENAVVIHGVRQGILPLFLTGTCFCNVLGTPALSMPVGPPSRPFSLHMTTELESDRELLAMADCLRRALC
ncbi:amidase [Rhizobium sp. VS19-DR104.2]|uniref:amidase n=1 Tax=unclassified Rhizobium TaxID=2613769 RepID=UPI001CC4C501|nr:MULTISPECIES: amidase [unclassified Rhizobium]MBZ5762237.1 amidase [Rhizobium sp. VS19-DR96]MBZ5768253.1 amidase [Rhizobium sp. VS19-DR129.2]MBZ5775875.1 amidase [Rhizobium sp. VS19-DRK62.2]MBZ5787104.1 amidase [Rhizobium sp. VS19-DR121]MBZ5804178.1 amidase [Rhizobium sp. VS19-DR181]